ncbi:hypothetical protein [Micromonospora pattaloongensis]|uniref:hypothetical protein n=1 Tax=Micromonospora pattaloongensis TaxID=405436 RepID=UPI000B86F7BA|nr:hypothetical protein [Micromonospora pattaloongensis]
MRIEADWPTTVAEARQSRIVPLVDLAGPGPTAPETIARLDVGGKGWGWDVALEEFSYHVVFQLRATEPSGMIAVRGWSGALHAVIWDVPDRAWGFNPTLAAPWIFDDQYADRQRLVSRQDAERIARERLGTELPSEQELLRMCLADGQGLNGT